MESLLLQYIKQQQLFRPSERVLIAASAGIDSTVLCLLMQKLKMSFGIAHCNFLLRGKSSEEDELFIKNLAKTLAVPFFSTQFETEKTAETRKQSIQVVARDLRYEWLEKTRQENGFAYIATAHHRNDSIETALYNFSKGCGIRGLHGIRPKIGKIIRPLLYATKEEIVEYANKHQIEFREDASNASDKYARNKIRHHVTPALKSINPSFEQSAATTIQNLAETELLFDFLLQSIKENILEEENKLTRISIAALLQYPATATVLFELLRPYQFHSDQVRQLVTRIGTQAGSRFYSETHELLLDRKEILIRPKPQLTQTSYSISKETTEIKLEDGCLKISFQEGIPSSLKTAPTAAYLDASSLGFPLQLRRWQAGDWFQPFGMQGKRQKLKDFFTNQKLSRFEKEDVWIMESADGRICWVVGMRIDERFKIKAATTECVYFQFDS